MPTQILRPNADGDQNQWAMSSGASPSAMVDDPGAHDGDATYIYTYDQYFRVRMNFENFTNAYTSITQVLFKYVARNTLTPVTNGIQVAGYADGGVVSWQGNPANLTTSYTTITADITSATATWTAATLNSLMFGVMTMIDDSNETRVTQMWFEVTYTPAVKSGSFGCYATIGEPAVGTFQILRPNAVGTYDTWLKSSGTTAHTLIDEPDAHDGDFTYIYPPGDYQFFSTHVENLVGYTSQIAAVVLKIVARKESAVDVVYLDAFLLLGGTDSFGGVLTLTNEYEEYSIDFSSAADFDPWTTDKLNNIQIFTYNYGDGSTAVRITQAWIEVTYNAPAPRTGSYRAFVYGRDTTPGFSLILRPNADFFGDDWTASPGPTQWQMIDEAGAHDGDTTYIHTTGTYAAFFTEFDDFTPLYGSITSVVLKVVARTVALPSAKTSGGVEIAGYSWSLGEYDLTTSYVEYTFDLLAMTPNPVWTHTDLNSILAGFTKLTGVANQIRVTQQWIEVTYRPPISTGSLGAYVKGVAQDSGSLGLYVLGFAIPTGTVQVLRPTTDGTYDAWSTSAGTDSAAMIGESGLHDGDLSYIWSNTINQKTTINVDDFFAAFYQITRVVLKFVARKNFDTGTHSIGTVAIIGGIEDQYASFDLTNVYAEYSADLTTGSLAWSKSVIDNMQVGFVRYLATSNYIRVTQAWVEITYSVPGTTQTGSTGAYARGNVSQSGSYGAYTSAREPASGSFGSFAQSSGFQTGTSGAFSSGVASQIGSYGAYVFGPTPTSSVGSRAAYVSGAIPQSGSYGVYVRAVELGSGEFGVYTFGMVLDSGSFSLYVRAVLYGGGSYGAYIQGPVRVSASQGAYTRGKGRSRALYRITAIEGPVTGSWAKVFGDMVGRARLHLETQNEASGTILMMLTNYYETWPWSEVITYYANACYFPSASLYPATTIYPC